MTLHLLTLPPSTNHLYAQRGNSRFLKPEVRDAKEAMGWEAGSQYRGQPLQGALKAEIDLYWPDHRKHDVDNIKALLDALTGILWEDDGQIVDLHLRKHYSADTPGVVIDFKSVD